MNSIGTKKSPSLYVQSECYSSKLRVQSVLAFVIYLNRGLIFTAFANEKLSKRTLGSFIAGYRTTTEEK